MKKKGKTIKEVEKRGSDIKRGKRQKEIRENNPREEKRKRAGKSILERK